MTKTKSAQKRAKLPNHGFLSSNQRTAYFLAPNLERNKNNASIKLLNQQRKYNFYLVTAMK